MRAYLNCAGTSWPKPEPVRDAVREVTESEPTAWAARFERDLHAVAEALAVDPSRLLPTPGCTSALALGLADLPWEPGDRLLVSSMEHHGLMRPVELLTRRGVEVVRIPPAGERPLDLEALERELHRGARGVALSHAVNVTGALLPIAEASALAHAHDAVVLVDAAQTAGWLPLPTADLVAFAGHKGPQAPWGIGGLVARPGLAMVTPAAVCTLGDGPSCAPMPGYCDAGSVDRVALAGLAAGLRWMADQDYALERARVQVSLLETRVRHKGGTVLGPPSGERMPTVAFTTDRPVAELGQALAAEGIIASAGLQCSPVAHETLGTAPDGVVRLSVGPLVTDDAIDATIEVLDAVL